MLECFLFATGIDFLLDNSPKMEVFFMKKYGRMKNIYIDAFIQIFVENVSEHFGNCQHR